MSEDRYKEGQSYIIDVESGAETARLIDQDRLMTEGMGGVLAEQDDLTNVAAILDIACGPGGWVQDVALANPQIEVTGVDLSQTMITYAQTMARVRHLRNAHFRVVDVLKGLDFPDDAFDLVNIRFIASFMTPDTWKLLLEECHRVLRPGGIFRLTENDWITFNNNATAQILGRMALKAMVRTKRSYGGSDWNGVLIPYLIQFCTEAGFTPLQKKIHLIDYSYGNAAHEYFYQDWLLVSQLLQPFLSATGVATVEELTQLREQFLNEMQEKSFCGLFQYYTLWGFNTK